MCEILATGDCSPAAVDLFQGFITYDSGRRRSAQESLDHYYFMEEDPPPEPIAEMPIPRYKFTNSNDLFYRWLYFILSNVCVFIPLNFHLRPKSKDFSKAGNGGPGNSRKETHNECDIDNMTFENIFEDFFHFTSDNGSEEEE